MSGGNIAADNLRSFVERIEHVKDEIDALNQDVRDIYAEAKSAGFDKTALGQVVAIRRKEAKNPDAFAEKQALVDLYLETLGASHTHTCARESRIEVAATAVAVATRNRPVSKATPPVSGADDAREGVVATAPSLAQVADPRTPPAAQDRGAMVKGQHGSAEVAAGTSAIIDAQAGQSVAVEEGRVGQGQNGGANTVLGAGLSETGQCNSELSAFRRGKGPSVRPEAPEPRTSLDLPAPSGAGLSGVETSELRSADLDDGSGPTQDTGPLPSTTEVERRGADSASADTIPPDCERRDPAFIARLKSLSPEISAGASS
jgi:uncharacterized protein (UPF0335 family)